jgi:predicted nucleic acid-binding protein
LSPGTGVRPAPAFVDTSVVLYLLSADPSKANRAEEVLATRCHLSVQVLNEFASVARRTLGMDWSEIGEVSDVLARTCAVEPLTLDTHRKGLALASALQLSVYDGMILASAVLAGCRTLFSEDLQDGLRVDGQLTVSNPFRAA